jgi:hypothetical protein
MDGEAGSEGCGRIAEKPDVIWVAASSNGEGISKPEKFIPGL